MQLAIRKLGYSRNPWRLVDLDGEADHSGPQQIVVPVAFDHPTLGRTTIDEAVSGSTKTECIEQTLAILGRLIEQRTAGQRS
jgi:hypothetical protein